MSQTAEAQLQRRSCVRADGSTTKERQWAAAHWLAPNLVYMEPGTQWEWRQHTRPVTPHLCWKSNESQGVRATETHPAPQKGPEGQKTEPGLRALPSFPQTHHAGDGPGWCPQDPAHVPGLF